MNGLAGAVHPAGADGDVGAVFEGGDQALCLFHGGREVGVGEHDDVAGGLQEAVADGVAFALVAGILDEMEAWMDGHPALNDGGGVVLGPVVDDEDFGVPVALGDTGENTLESVLDAGAFVVRGNDNTKLRMRH